MKNKLKRRLKHKVKNGNKTTTAAGGRTLHQRFAKIAQKLPQ